MSYDTFKTASVRNAPSFVTITELPINGYLSIDGKPLYINQDVINEDISRMIFTADQGIRCTFYGNLKFIINDGDGGTTEQSFVIDTDMINEALEIERMEKDVIVLQSKFSPNLNNHNVREKFIKSVNNSNADKKKDNNNLNSKSKRKSNPDLINSYSGWVSATDLNIFED